MSFSVVAVPLKATDKVSFNKLIKAHIKTVFKDEPERFDGDGKTLDQLRLEATGSVNTDVVLKYYQQVTHVAFKFPFGENAIKIYFTWTNAFAGKKRVGMPLIKYERACVLFNLAAAHSQMAAKQNLQTAEGLKVACNSFQIAAGVFDSLKTIVEESFPKGAPVDDISVPVVRSLSLFMLAQAQETFYFKVIIDKKKDSLISSIASYTADLYDQAFDAVASDMSKHPFDEKDDWLHQMQAKALFYHAVAQTRQASVDIAAEKFAEEICRLENAQRFLESASKLAKNNPALLAEIKACMAVSATRLPKARKDNELIYGKTIPNLGDIAPVVRTPMTKIIPFDPELNKVIPLYAELVPLGIVKATNEYNTVKATFVQQQLALIDQSSASISGSLEAMNLPATIDALMQPIGLPPRVIERTRKVREDGGVDSIIIMLEGTKSASHDCHEALNKAERTLDDEERQDIDMRHQFTTRWTRAPSTKLTENLRNDLVQFRSALRSAAQTDERLAASFAAARVGIEALSGSQEDLERTIPSSVASNTPVSTSSEVKLVKSLLDQVSPLQECLTKLADEIKATAQSDDITVYLLENNLDSLDGQQSHSVFQLRLSERYSDKTASLNTIITKKDTLLAQLTDANAKFTASRKGNEIISARESALCSLDAAFNSYEVLVGNLQMATKFYSEMNDSINVFLTKCGDYVFARKTEMRDLISDIQSTLTGVTVTSQPPYAAPPPQATAPFYQAYQQHNISPQPMNFYGQYGNPYHGAAPQPSPQYPPGARFDPMTGRPLP